jgi:endonuclease YncB( thermonuclease family)
MPVLSRLLLPLIIWLAAVSPAMALEVVGTVVRVSDGDTLAVQVPNQRQLEKIRLLGIDCPEVAHGANDPGQEPWGTRAKEFAAKLVLNKQVRIETDVQPRDKYGRLLGYVFIGKTFVNLELVRNGHAMLLTYAPNVKYVDQFTKAQREAREAGRGLWDPKDQLTESPHTYRHNGHHKGDGHVVDEAIQEENKKPAAHPNASRSRPRTSRPAAAPAQAPATGTAASANGGTVLYNAKSGKYHEPGCRYASGPNVHEVPRAEAEAQGKPCQACHPH